MKSQQLEATPGAEQSLENITASASSSSSELTDTDSENDLDNSQVPVIVCSKCNRQVTRAEIGYELGVGLSNGTPAKIVMCINCSGNNCVRRNAWTGAVTLAPRQNLKEDAWQKAVAARKAESKRFHEKEAERLAGERANLQPVQPSFIPGSTAQAGRRASAVDGEQTFACAKTITLLLSELVNPEIWREHGVNPAEREQHLCDSEFVEVFGVQRLDFYKLPKWKRDAEKRKRGLF